MVVDFWVCHWWWCGARLMVVDEGFAVGGGGAGFR